MYLNDTVLHTCRLSVRQLLVGGLALMRLAVITTATMQTLEAAGDL